MPNATGSPAQSSPVSIPVSLSISDSHAHVYTPISIYPLLPVIFPGRSARVSGWDELGGPGRLFCWAAVRLVRHTIVGLHMLMMTSGPDRRLGSILATATATALATRGMRSLGGERSRQGRRNQRSGRLWAQVMVKLQQRQQMKW